MRFLLLLFLALAAGIALTIFVENPGYVLITREPWSVETSLTLFAIGLLLSFVIFYLFVRLLNNLFSTPEKVRRWQNRRHLDHAIEDTRKGLAEAINGNLTQAEKLLTRSLPDSPQAEINLLATAWIAQQKDEHQKRDDYIAQASNLESASTDTAEMAIGLTQCSLLQQAGQTEQALATARMLHEKSPANPAAIKNLVKLLLETEQWQELLPVLTQANRHHVLPENEQKILETQAASGLLTTSENITDLEKHWKSLSKKAHKETAIIASYCRRLKEFNRHQEAETLIRNTLKHQWSEELVGIYGQLKTANPGSQLKQAESWLTEHPTNTQLMLCMGRLAILNQLWGMARSFLEVAAQNGDSNDALLELAWLLESLNERDSALQYYKSGLENSLGNRQQGFSISANSRLDLKSNGEATKAPGAAQNLEPEQETQPPSLAYSNESK
ncbi:MAG: heme biosynthesis HemY N-terminal domain-containing protein [Arenicellales bacterium]